jgi:hypothetical protein
MKANCEAPDCKRQVANICGLCGLKICSYHSYDFVVDFDRKEFWRIREGLFYCRAYRDYCVGNTAQPPMSNPTTQNSRSAENRDLICYPSHRNFYQYVLPFVRLPPSSDHKFCRACLDKTVHDCNKILDDGFFPVLQTHQFDGSICGALECCLLDVDKRKPSRCSSCGKYCCTQHAAYCCNCQRTFCTNNLLVFSPQDPTVWGGMGYYVHGGCAGQHRHKLFALISYPAPPHNWLSLKYL